VVANERNPRAKAAAATIPVPPAHTNDRAPENAPSGIRSMVRG